MQKSYVYKSTALHIAVFLLCVADINFLSGKREFDEQPPIIVDLENITISDTTNIPELAVRGEEKKQATRKEKPAEENSSPKQAEEKPLPKEEPKPEPVVEASEIKTPSLIEEVSKQEDIKEEPKKESKEPIKEKKKPAPVPQKKPQVKPVKKTEPKKKPEQKKETKPVNKTPLKKKPATVKKANPLESLMNSVDDLQKQIGAEDTPAQIPHNEPVNNMGIEGGNSKGSYFSDLSISGVDYVKSKIQEAWKISGSGKDDRNIEVVISVKLTKEGNLIPGAVTIENMKRYRSDTYFSALADSAERAIYLAQDAFKVLAKQSSARYNDWKVIRFTFTPLGLSK